MSNPILGANRHAGAKPAALAGILLAAAALAVTGCQKAIDTKNLADDPTVTNTSFDARMDFWHTLATDRICSNDEAFHGLLLYIEKADQAHTYDDRVKLMRSLGMLPDDFKGKANEAVTRGVVAVALVKVLEIKGGILLHLFDKSERYATRELVFQGIYPPSTPNQVFSGAEFIGIIGQMEDYQRAFPPSTPPSEVMQAPSPPPMLARPAEEPVAAPATQTKAEPTAQTAPGQEPKP